MAAPIPDKSVDVVISQEALLHIPDRRRAMAEAFRILKRGGRLAFTDWIAPAPLAKDDADLLWEGQAVQALESPESYRRLADGHRFSRPLLRRLDRPVGGAAESASGDVPKAAA